MGFTFLEMCFKGILKEHKVYTFSQSTIVANTSHFSSYHSALHLKQACEVSMYATSICSLFTEQVSRHI